MDKLLLISLIVLIPSEVGCSRNDTKTTLTDADLKKEIEAKISSDTQLSGANLSITTDAEHNAATISGTVESETLRNRAVDLIKDAHAGLTVEDKIDVKPRELSRAEYSAENARLERERAKERKDRLGSSVDDAWIHAKIVAKLIGNTTTPKRTINVDVNKGVVTLRGAVDNAKQKADAERISKETEGVKRVNNVLKVSKTR